MKDINGSVRILARLAFALVISLWVNQGFAQFYVEGSLRPVMKDSNKSIHDHGGSFTGEPAVKPESTFGFETRFTLGYIFWERMLLGLSYNMHSYTESRSAVSGGSDAFDRSVSEAEYGPTLGYVQNGWRFALTQLMSGNKKETLKYKDASGTVTTDSTTTLKLGSGMQLAFGYSFRVWGALEIGPTLIYRKVDYKSVNYKNKLDAASNYDRSFKSDASNAELAAFFTLAARF